MEALDEHYGIKGAVQIHGGAYMPSDVFAMAGCKVLAKDPVCAEARVSSVINVELERYYVAVSQGKRLRFEVK